MKRFLCTFVGIVVVISCYAQGTFNYCTMRNRIWGEWESSVNPFDRYLIDKVGDNEWIIYRYCNHPSNYLFKLKINNFYFDKDKKSRKEHLKNNKWYEFQKILPQKYRQFFKDHDFVEIDLEDKIIFIDTSLQDLTGYRFYQTISN